MSEYILCKGKKPLCFTNRITICDLDDFLIGKAKEIWWTANSVWTIEIDNHEIDDVLTEAQEKLNSGEQDYNETLFYRVINGITNPSGMCEVFFMIER